MTEQLPPPSSPATRCYAWPLTVTGGVLDLHVSTKHERFAVRLFRCGASIAAVTAPEGEFEGADLPLGPPDAAWGWPVHRVPLPEDLADGVYAAVPVPVGAAAHGGGPGDGVTADASVLTRRDACLFVLARARSRAGAGREGGAMLYKLPTATYSAYNQLGGVSLYAGAHWTRDWAGQGYVVSLQRPGNGGIGGRVMEGDAPDYHARTSRRQVFAHWDYPFVAWMESHGYAPSYCTDFDLDADDTLLDGVSFLVSSGHDEYWSPTMRRRVLELVDRGGNVALFTGDTACFEIEVSAAGDRLLCAKMAGGGPDDGGLRPGALWHLDDPGDWLTLGSPVWGGGWWDGRRAIEGYQPVVGSHWAFDGVEFPPEGITGGEDTPIVGYETDGVLLERDTDALRMRSAAKGGAGGRVLLAVAKLSSGWVGGYDQANAAMMLRTARSGGMVFNCGTTDWPLGLADDAVGRITENVVSALAKPSLVVRGPIYAPGEELSDGEVVGEGQVVSWYVDGTQVDDHGLGAPDWTVVGGEPVAGGTAGSGAARSSAVLSGAVLSTRAGGGDGWLTVTASCRDGSGLEHFGSRTIQVVPHEQYLQRRIVRVMHAMANPDEQGGALVDQKASESELASRVIPIRLQWVKHHAAALADLMSELESMWEGQGRMAEASLREDEK